MPHPKESLGPSNAHRAVLRGDLRAVRAVVAQLEADGSTEARAWRIALRAAWWHADPKEGALPSLAEVRDFLDDGPASRRAAALASIDCVRASVLAADPSAVNRFTEVLLTLRRNEKGETALWADVGGSWLALFRGHPDEAAALAERAFKKASELASAVGVVESTVLRAMAASVAGDLEAALAHARRASRMARTEAIPPSEYLAHTVLARMRRLSGRAHLATRILTAVAHLAPQPWHAWVAWELILAGEPTPEPNGGSSPDRWFTASRALASLFLAGREGDVSRFADARRRAVEVTAECAFLRDDLGLLLSAADPAASLEHACPEVRRWCRGESDALPLPLAGLARGGTDGADSESTVVWAQQGTARRVIGVGVPMLPGGRMDAGPRRQAGRVEALIAALALAPEGGVPLEDLFRRVYGFAYQPRLHAGVFKVLLHRARKSVASHASIERSSDAIRLVVHEPFAVPDPGSVQPLEIRVLQVLARRTHGITARAAAADLKIPLRTAQGLLQQLVSEGGCVVERKGRRIEYRVEDTTFSEPTGYGS